MAISDAAALLLRIKGDSSHAVQELDAFRKEFKKTEKGIKDSGGIVSNAFLEMARSAGLTGKETAALKANFTDLAKVGAVAAAGVAAVGAAAIGVGVALFKLASNAAAYGGEIEAAMNKTGLGAETLSALKHRADQAGIGLDVVTNGLARFAKNVSTAGEDVKKATAFFEDFGITPQAALDDLDTAMGKVFKRIVDAKPGVEQLTLAQTAFGRSGAELIDFLDSFDGDLAQAIKRAKELGLTLTDDAARSAAEFEDQMFDLNAQMTAVQHTIGRELMPVFRTWAGELSGWLATNKGEVSDWAASIAKTLNTLKNDIQKETDDIAGMKGFWDSFWAGDTWAEYREKNEARLAAIRNRRFPTAYDPNAENPVIGGPLATRFPTAKTATPFDPVDKEAEKAVKKAQDDAKKAAEKAQKEAEDLRKRQLQGQLGQIDAIQAAEQHALDRMTAAHKAAFEARAIDSKTYLALRLEGEEAFAKGAIEDISREYELKRQQEKLSSEQLKALKLAEELELQKVVDTRFEREEQAKKEAADRDKKLTEEELVAAKEVMERRLALHEATGDKIYAVAVANAAKEKTTLEQLAVLQQAIAERTLAFRIKLTKEYFDRLIVGSKEYLAIANQILILEQNLEKLRAENHTADKKRAEERLEYWQESLDKLREISEQIDKDRIKQAEDDERRREREKKQREENEKEGRDRFGEDHPFGVGFLEGLNDATGNIEDFGDVLTNLGDVAFQTFAQMGAGLANMVQNWVLLGDQAEISMRKMLAATLAGFAAQAAQLAVFHVAMGIAAMTPWGFFVYGSPAQHFAAAALWAGLAGGAALAGRALAGDSFRQQTAAGGVSAAGLTSGSRSGADRNVAGQGQAYSSFGDKAYIQEEGRSAPLGVQVELSFKDKPAWFTQMFIAEWRANGRIRRLVEDGR